MIEVKNVSYTYSDSKEKALNNVSFTVNDGEIVLCTGRSGCGKSTVIRVINGLCPSYYGGTLEGSVSIDSEITASMDLTGISRKVGTLFQDPERQFFALNVEDEIVFALEWMGLSRDEIKRRLESVIKRFSLEDIRNNSIAALSEGQKQKVGLAEIVALHGKNIILDEPTANLDPQSTEDLARLLFELKQEGYCIFIVDHRHYWLNAIADRVLIMSNGKIEKEGNFSILDNASLQKEYGLRKAYVTDRRALLKDLEPNGDDYVVKGEHVAFSYKDGKTIFKDLNFAVPEGINVLIGENGIGKTTLSRLIFGLEKLSGGKIEFKEPKGKKPLQLGSIVLQNTDYQLNMQTVYQEVAICMTLAEGIKPQPGKVMELLEKLDLSALSYRHPQSLSGGQKQRLVIACALAKNPQVLVLDEPTSGLDGANMQRIKNILHDYAKDGRAALVITHDLELIDDKNLKALRLKKETV
ncbi:ATP-binding cassette domain-containing protein [Succinatimonas hippei]|uniref:ABC transporter ATP-binding protein n=1 Tax=Succinatimonas hippei TaxID=626938 RepID=UPI0025A34172|nr:ABC transporter ATP-binding protein [Succinatimonas hippei]MDM8120807.1 ATP-binding cassette domain-containing protein [Succinatimonas hippei]